MDFLINQGGKSLSRMTMKERAASHCLPERLRVVDIAALSFPEQKNKQAILRAELERLCEVEEIKHSIETVGACFTLTGGSGPNKQIGTTDFYLIHRDALKAYLQRQKQWPVDGLLANWWPDETQAAPQQLPEVEAVSQSKGRKRKDMLTVAIEAAIVRLKKKPSFDELWSYFQSDKDETGNIEDFDDGKITWKDTKGRLHDVPKRSLANRLSRIKS